MNCEYRTYCDLIIDGECKDAVKISIASTIPYNPPVGHEIYITEDIFHVISSEWDDGSQTLEILLEGLSNFSDNNTFEAHIKAWKSYGWSIERNP